MARRAEAVMGTTISIEATDADAIARAFEWFALVEQHCTRFDPQSELSQLSTHVNEPTGVSVLLFEAIQFAVQMARVTGGAFDPTVGAAMASRGFNREHRTGRVVGDPAGTEQSSYTDIELDPDRQTVRLRRALQLDLGAVAKGLAIDLAARELSPLRDFAIDAGGDLYLGGVNHDRQPWSVGIRHPFTAGGFIAGVRVSDKAVCTSGTYERGEHILDPRTGSSPTAAASVTVVADSAMLADALATAAFVLGPTEGLDLLKRMEVEGLIVTSDLTAIETEGWPRE